MGYGGYSTWDPWGMGYGYPYGGYGSPYGGYGYGGYSPWGGMTSTNPSSGGTTNQPVSGNISLRRMNIAGGPATRRPSVVNVAGRTADRPGTLEEGKGQRTPQEGIQGRPMRSVETHTGNPSRDEVGRTPTGTIHYANPPQRAEPRQPETQRPKTGRPETETRRPPMVRQPEAQRSAPRAEQSQRSYSPPQRQEPQRSSERSYNEPSRSTPSRSYSEPARPASTPSYQAPARSSSPPPSRSTGGRGGR